MQHTKGFKLSLDLLRSESPSGKCANRHTVAASNNRDHTPGSLLFVGATYISLLFFEHIPFVVNRAFSATPAEWLQQTHKFVQAIIRNIRFRNIFEKRRTEVFTKFLTLL